MGEAAGGSSVPPPPAEAGGGQVNALTVLALLEKLVSMLEAVEGQQRQMEQRQRGLEGAVRGIQGDLGKLCRSHGATGEAVEKLLEKSRKVCAHTRAVRERLERQCAQVRRLEQHHAQLLRRDRFKVLIFQVRGPGGAWGAQPGTGGTGDKGPSRWTQAAGGKGPSRWPYPAWGQGPVPRTLPSQRQGPHLHRLLSKPGKEPFSANFPTRKTRFAHLLPVSKLEDKSPVLPALRQLGESARLATPQPAQGNQPLH